MIATLNLISAGAALAAAYFWLHAARADYTPHHLMVGGKPTHTAFATMAGDERSSFATVGPLKDYLEKSNRANARGAGCAAVSALLQGLALSWPFLLGVFT